MPKRFKKALDWILQIIGPWAIRLIGYSLRVERVNGEAIDELQRRHQPYLFCAWHGRLFLPVFWNRQRGIVAMVSQHSDGEMISRIVKKFGYGTVRGSSTRGGKEAFYQLLAHLKSGGAGAMIPDGPTGPRYVLKMGAIFLAQQAGVPLVPVSFAAKSSWRFNSWDRMVLPKPFSRAVLYHGDPITISSGLDPGELEEQRQKVEQVMRDLVVTAERHLGLVFDRAEFGEKMPNPENHRD